MAWHFSADIHETRKIRRLTTSKLLSSSLQKQRRTRVFFNWVSYTHHKKHLRASESHVVFKRQLFLKRRFFREWKDVEWLKYFSGILDKWYRMSMGQMLQIIQRRAMKSLSEMWDRTSINILAGMPAPKSLPHTYDSQSAGDTPSNPSTKENRAVQFQDSLLHELHESPSKFQNQEMSREALDGGGDCKKKAIPPRSPRSNFAAASVSSDTNKTGTSPKANKTSPTRSKTPPKLQKYSSGSSNGAQKSGSISEKLEKSDGTSGKDRCKKTPDKKTVARVARYGPVVARSSPSTNLLKSPRPSSVTTPRGSSVTRSSNTARSVSSSSSRPK